MIFYLSLSTLFSVIYHSVVAARMILSDDSYAKAKSILVGLSIVSRGLYLVLFTFLVMLWGWLAALFTRLKKEKI
jgi:succinate dehydrogenase hydrophobic anchor subunit